MSQPSASAPSRSNRCASSRSPELTSKICSQTQDNMPSTPVGLQRVCGEWVLSPSADPVQPSRDLWLGLHRCRVARGDASPSSHLLRSFSEDHRGQFSKPCYNRKANRTHLKQAMLGLCCRATVAHSSQKQPYITKDAAFLLAVGSFLLAVELFFLKLTILAFILTVGAFCSQF